MRRFRFLSLLFSMSLSVLAFAGNPAQAQEGHPLKGSWIGEWKGNDISGDFVLLVLDWNGKEVTGIINPGTDDIVIESVKLDPKDWSVKIAAQTEVDGKKLNYSIDGKINSLELPTRSIVGTWKSQRGRGDFEISRQ